MTPRFYFLFATLLTLPFAVRKVIWVNEAPYFKEYSDISLYFFEIFLVGYVFLYILEHISNKKSIYRDLFHVEQFLILLLLSLSTIFASIFESRYYNLYFILRWSLYATFALFLYKDLSQIVPRGTINTKNKQKCSTWNTLRFTLLLSLTLQSIFIIFQILSQKSLGLIYLGESILNTSIAGVSTIIINNKEFLRGYGTFLHPNITAFFFFAYGIAYILLSNVPRGTMIPLHKYENCSTWNIVYKKRINILQNLFHVEHSPFKILKKIVPRGTMIVLYSIILVAFFFTFSKSVIGIAILIVFLWLLFEIVPRGTLPFQNTKKNCSTWNTQKVRVVNIYQKLFHVEQLKNTLYNNVPRGTIVFLTVILSYFLISDLFRLDFVQQSILERKLQYLSIPSMSWTEFFVGRGLGSYVEILAEKSPGLYFWQLQPIHNTYILLIFEIGLLPLLGISLYLWQKYKKYRYYPQFVSLSVLQKKVLWVVGGTALLLGVDHYTWDIEQGQFLFVFFITILLFVFKDASHQEDSPREK